MKSVAIVDPYITGHHTVYMKCFVKVLLEQGHQVTIFFPAPNEIETYIFENCNYLSLKCFPYFDENEEERASGKFYAVFANWQSVIKRWIKIKKLLNFIEKSEKIHFDIIFFAWLDSYTFKLIPRVFLEKYFKYPWCGLYFHPYLRMSPERDNKKSKFIDNDYLLGAKNCKGVAILDKFLEKPLAKRIVNRVVIFPDFANSKMSSEESFLIKRIKKNANGRTIVGMIGLSKRKGTLILIRLAKVAKSTEFYFVFAGELTKNDYSDSEIKEITNFFDERRENCEIVINKPETEEAYNSLFNVFDIPFLLYQDFYGSSNLLTKAAILGKRVLATDKHYIGQAVKFFNLGTCVDEKDLNASMKGLIVLKEQIQSNSADNSGLIQFAAENEIGKLNEGFLKLFR